MDFLLHICCAPCLIYPLEQLRKEGFLVSGFFYNPNIHPFSEYKKRKETLEKFSQEVNLCVDYPEYRPQDFFQAVNFKEELPQRCATCWRLRLEKTAQAAKKCGFKYFSTTLLVSPYQDQEWLKKIGSEIAQELEIEFYYKDFRLGFKKAHQEAKLKGLYCQKYCGCIYSEIERYNKK